MRCIMNIKKILLTSLVVVSTAALLTGCGGEQKKADTKTAELPKKIVVGLDDNFPPMGFKDKDGKLVGFDIDMATEAGKRLGIPVEFKSIDWSSKEAELKTKKVDALWNGLTITEERKKNILYSNPYMNNEQIIVVKADSPIKALGDLKDKVVGTQEGSSSVDAIEKNKDFKKSLNSVKLYGDFVAAFLDLEVGRIDAMVVDSVVGRYYMVQKPGQFKDLSQGIDSELFGVGMRLEDKALKAKLDETLATMKKDGTSAKISQKWFGKDVTK